ncbi:hypothetical protein, partial [Enterobacter hormaechei]
GLYAGLPGEMKGYCAGCGPHPHPLPHPAGLTLLFWPVDHQKPERNPVQKKQRQGVENQTEIGPPNPVYYKKNNLPTNKKICILRWGPEH